MMRAVCRSAAALSLALFAQPPLLYAQGSLREQTQALAGGMPRHVIAINPFIPLAGYFQGEYEQRVQDNISIAVAGSYTPFNNREYSNLDVKLRLYPNDRALQGFGVAAGIGVGRARQNDQDIVCITAPCFPIRGTMLTAPTFSIEAHQQWLFGANRSTAITVGGGMKRYYFDQEDTSGRGVSRLLPTGRLTIGWAFR
jgi:hypothetical protein